ncbi:hypothetical protein IWW48_001521, partial [Coemansia sp. RSA 1200]
DLLQLGQYQNLAMQQQFNREFIETNNLYYEHIAEYEQQETERLQQNPEIERQRRAYQQRKQEFRRWQQHRYWQQQQRQYRRDRRQQRGMRHEEIETKRVLGFQRQVQNEMRQLQLLRDTRGPDPEGQGEVRYRRQRQRQRHRQRHQAERVAYRMERKENPPQQPLHRKRMLVKLGFRLLHIDEYLTPTMCPYCETGKLKKFLQVGNPRPHRRSVQPVITSHAVLRCENITCIGRVADGQSDLMHPRCLNRDLAAAMNFRHIANGLQKNGAVPERFQRGNRVRDNAAVPDNSEVPPDGSPLNIDAQTKH